MWINQTSIYLISAIMLLQTCVSRQKIDDEVFAPRDEYVNQELTYEGYVKENQINIMEKDGPIIETIDDYEGKYGDDIENNESTDQQHFVIYKMPENKGDSLHMAFELYPKMDSAIAGQNSTEKFVDMSKPTGKYYDNSINLKKQFFQNYLIPEDVFELFVTVKHNDCLALYAYLSHSDELPKIAVDNKSQIVFMKFQNENKLFSSSQILNSPITNGLNKFEIPGSFDSKKPKYLNLFCPFWKKKVLSSFDGKMYYKRMKDLDYPYGKFFNKLI